MLLHSYDAYSFDYMHYVQNTNEWLGPHPKQQMIVLFFPFGLYRQLCRAGRTRPYKNAPTYNSSWEFEYVNVLFISLHLITEFHSFLPSFIHTFFCSVFRILRFILAPLYLFFKIFEFSILIYNSTRSGRLLEYCLQ